MIKLWAAGCYGCRDFSAISIHRDVARAFAAAHRSKCKLVRIYHVVLVATK